MEGGGGGGEGDAPGEARGVGPVFRLAYRANARKHGPVARGRISREPVNGQDALDYSVRIKATSRMRVGVDYDDAALVVFQWHNAGEFHESMNFEIFLGYVVEWRDMTQEQKNALLRWGFVNLKGKIL